MPSVWRLVQVEGLRLWRIAALYDVPTPSLDSMWPVLAAAFLPIDPPPSDPPSAESQPSAAGRHSATSRVVAREALLVAAELVYAAVRCRSLPTQMHTDATQSGLPVLMPLHWFSCSTEALHGFF